MTRKEENETLLAEIIKRADNNPDGTFQEIVAFQLSIITSILADMSKSLATIADKEVKE